MGSGPISRKRGHSPFRSRYTRPPPWRLGMSATTEQKARAFRALHAGPEPFVIANCWDGGSARILGGLGFQALATSSGACAATYGRMDGDITLDQSLAHARIICAATDLPVSADLEKG